MFCRKRILSDNKIARALCALLALCLALCLALTLAACGGTDGQPSDPANEDLPTGVLSDGSGLTYRKSADGKTLSVVGFTGGGSLTVPDSFSGLPVTAIGEAAFAHCTSLTNLTVPDGIVAIGASAFAGCAALESISLPARLTAIERETFSGCSALTSVVLPAAVTSIGEAAFSGCTALADVSLPEALGSVGTGAFYKCDALNLTPYGGALYLGNADNPYLALLRALDKEVEKVEVHENTRVICDAFHSCRALKNISIPASVVYIDSGAFYSCDDLEYNAFDGGLYLGGAEDPYLLLMRVTVQDQTKFSAAPGAKFICADAFGGCEALTDLYLPATLRAVGRAAFSDCAALKAVSFGGSATEWAKILIEPDNEPLTSAKILVENVG